MVRGGVLSGRGRRSITTGKPFEALPYYQRIAGLPDVADAVLTRPVYRILGTWENDETTAEFLADGTYTFSDAAGYFTVEDQMLLTGAAPISCPLYIISPALPIRSSP